MNKEILDKLIESFVNEQKGGVEATTQQTSGTSDSLGLDISEIANIIVTGTESENLLKSTDAALDTLVANSSITFDYSSAQALADSFSFLDFRSQELLQERCSSLGGLVSKISLAAGLISILEYFNAATGGFVNEAFVASLMNGQSVPAGAGGIEDIVVQNGTIGISLKTKTTEDLGGSLANLCETLGIKYFKVAEKKPIAQRSDTQIISKKVTVDGEKKLAHFVTPNGPLFEGGLYYLSFVKAGSGGNFAIKTYKVTTRDVVKSAARTRSGGIAGGGFYKLETLSNILKDKTARESIREKGSFVMQTSLTAEDFNNVLTAEIREVFESLKTLDAWFGQMKQKLISYVSTLEKTNFDELQQHLDAGSEFTFKAFSVNSCPENQVQTQVTENKNNSDFSLDKFLEEVIIKYINS